MMIVERGHIYLDAKHIESLKAEDEYVRKRYHAVAKTLAPAPFGISRKDAAEMIGRSFRHFYRILKQFKNEGIAGLRFKSRRPKSSPNRTPGFIETIVITLRKATGFGPKPVAELANRVLSAKGDTTKVYPSLIYNILVRAGEIERVRRHLQACRRFEWGHPNRLIQADLTQFNGVNILTMEDDNARKGWSIALPDAKDTTVIQGMKQLVQIKYDNLLTDNGSQFSRMNARIRNYCKEHINEKHIWTSIHHPQTMGKLSAYQKGLKRFLHCRVGRSRNIQLINKWIRIYHLWYNNGHEHSETGMIPEERYSGKPDPDWFPKFMKSIKLEGLLTVK